MGRHGLLTSRCTHYYRITKTPEFREVDTGDFLGPKGYRGQLALDLCNLTPRVLLLQKLHRHQHGG